MGSTTSRHFPTTPGAFQRHFAGGGSDFYVAPGIYRELKRGEWDIVHVQSYHTFVAPLAMLVRRIGRIMNVASTAAFQPGPLMAVYYASKSFVLSFSEALANELSGSGVSVTCFCPGATTTGFAQRAHMEGSRLFRMQAMDARTAAQAGYEGMLRGQTLVIPGLSWPGNDATPYPLKFMLL